MNGHRETLAYVATGIISGISYLEIVNAAITTLVLVATLIYWIRKNRMLKTKDENDSGE